MRVTTTTTITSSSPLLFQVSTFDIALPPRPSTQARMHVPSASPLRFSEEKNSGYRSIDSSAAGAFLADVKIGVKKDGLSGHVIESETRVAKFAVVKDGMRRKRSDEVTHSTVHRIPFFLRLQCRSVL